MPEIKAIETRYKGYRMRSRLEARWAVFFDALEIKWEYEAEGYQTEVSEGEFVRYLPDFHITSRWDPIGTYVEVKGTNQALQDKANEYKEFLDWGSSLPGMDDSVGSDHGLLLLGNIPEPIFGLTFHPIIQHYKGLWKNFAYFAPSGVKVVKEDDSLLGYLAKLPFCSSLECASRYEWCIDSFQVATEYAHRKVIDAYTAARSARFEHGESG